MLDYSPFWKTCKEKGISQYDLINMGVGRSVMQRIRRITILSGNDTDKEECETTRILPFLLTIIHDHIPLEKSISSDMGSIEEIG